MGQWHPFFLFFLNFFSAHTTHNGRPCSGTHFATTENDEEPHIIQTRQPATKMLKVLLLSAKCVELYLGYRTPVGSLYKNNSKFIFLNQNLFFIFFYGEMKNLVEYFHNIAFDELESSKNKLFILACMNWVT